MTLASRSHRRYGAAMVRMGSLFVSMVIALLAPHGTRAAAGDLVDEIPEVVGPASRPAPDAVPQVVGPVPLPLRPPSPHGLRIHAERARFLKDENAVLLEGRVTIEHQPYLLMADSLRVDLDRGKMRALGRIEVIEGPHLLSCDRMSADLNKQEFLLSDVQFEVRDRALHLEDLLARHEGGHGELPGELWLHGSARQVTRAASGRLSFDLAEISTCDCYDPAPWKLGADRVEVISERGAWAYGPVLYVMDFPVAWLPVWYVPLQRRQSGLLAPQFQLRDGFWLLQPLFLTLGESADTTLAAGYVLDRGPRAEYELRWAPAAGSSGFLRLDGQWDEKFLAARAPARESWLVGRSDRGEAIPALRGALHLGHRTLAPRHALVADARLASDRLVAREFADSLGARVEPYLRSAAQASLVLDDHLVLTAHGGGYQDLGQQKLLFFPLPALTPYRAPVLSARVLPIGLGPLEGDGGLELLRVGLWGDGPGTTLAPDVLHRGWRLSIDPRLTWPLRLGDVLAANIGFGLRHALTVDDDGRSTTLTALNLAAGLETEVARTYHTTGSRWRHAARPFLRYVGVPILHRGGRATPVDEADRFSRTQQVLAGLRTTLELRQGAESREMLADLVVAQGVDVSRTIAPDATTEQRIPALADTVLSADLRYRGLSGRLLLVGDLASSTVATALSYVRLTFSERLRLALSYEYLGSQPGDLFFAAPHELFGGAAIPVPSLSTADRMAAGFGLSPMSPLEFGYGVELSLLDLEGQGGLGRNLLTHGGHITYRSPCRCWQLGIRVRFWPQQPLPDVGLTLSISGFGEDVSVL